MSAWVTQLEEYYRGVYESAMQDVAVCNHDLSVKVVKWVERKEAVLGVMVSPWFVSLFYKPTEYQVTRVGQTKEITLPAGVFEFMAQYNEALGEYLTNSLLSNMSQFEDQTTAIAFAQEAFDLVIAREKLENSLNESRPIKKVQPMTRRAFLFGRAAEQEPTHD